LIIIENLKKSVYSKFDKVDEEQKNLKDDNNKTRHEISQMKNDIDKTHKLTFTHSKQIEELYLLIEELKKEIKDHDEQLDKKLKEQFGKIQEYINSKIREYYRFKEG
jgi:chromosome segregation ATPase